MGDTLPEIKLEQPGIPRVCQYEKLFSPDEKAIQNESVTWITETNAKLPLWSRLCVGNYLGQAKRLPYGKTKNFEVEIPGRLLSLFGSTVVQTRYFNRMENMKSFHIYCSILALCASLNNDFDDWTSNLLDAITTSAANQYPEFLRKLPIPEKELTINHLNSHYILGGKEFKVQLQQVTGGYLYHRFGLRDLNLARALTWFFKHYQFGMIQCGQRSLVFGYTLDIDYGFFLYDCQTRGFPLFEDDRITSYILRTHHLQILLYCIIVTLKESHVMTKFSIYSADIRIINSLERRPLKKEKYVPIIQNPRKKTAANTNKIGPQIPVISDFKKRWDTKNVDLVTKRKKSKQTLGNSTKKIIGKNTDDATALKCFENKVDIFISSIPCPTNSAAVMIRQNTLPTILYNKKESLTDIKSSGIIFNSKTNTTATNSSTFHTEKQLTTANTLTKKAKRASSTTKVKSSKKKSELNEPTTTITKKKMDDRNQTASGTTIKKSSTKPTSSTFARHWKG